MNVCDNLGDHLVGNVYVKFRREEDAEKAVAELNNRWFNSRPIHCELSPVTDFREACCRQYEMGWVVAYVGNYLSGPALDLLYNCHIYKCMNNLFIFVVFRECTRGGFCNFMHLKPISRELRRELYGRGRRRSSKKYVAYFQQKKPFCTCLKGIDTVSKL